MPPLTRLQRAKIQEKLRNDVEERELCYRVREGLNKEFVVTWSQYEINNSLLKSYNLRIFAISLRIQEYEKILKYYKWIS